MPNIGFVASLSLKKIQLRGGLSTLSGFASLELQIGEGS